MKILTITVPSYNISKHVDRCVPFFIQCKCLSNMEILFIDDGSTDNTVNKLTFYQKRYPDSIRIISKENGGHGSAVNTGIKEATGKYFKVIDGDDWVESKNLDRLVRDLQNLDSDLVLNPYFKESQITGKRTRHGVWNVKKNKNMEMSVLPDNVSGFQLHEWTIKTEILKNNNITFTEKCYYDDFEYITYPIPYINTLIFLDYPVYNYLIDQSTQSVSDKNVYKNSWMSKKIVFNAIMFYEKHKPQNARANKYLMDTIISGCKQHYNIYLRNVSEQSAYEKWTNFDNDLRRYPEIYNNVGKKYIYISFARKYGKIGFLVDSLLIHIYKKIR